MKSGFILAQLSPQRCGIYNHLPIPSIRPSTRARSKLLNVSPVAPPCQVVYSSVCIVPVLIVMFINSFV